MRTWRLALAVALAAATAIAGDRSPAAAGAPETVRFDSVTPASPDQLLRHAWSADSKVSINAELYLPGDGRGRLPVVVVAADGDEAAAERQIRWAHRLLRLGIGALVIDSIRSRGLPSASLYLSVQSIAADVADAFAALRYLAQDPRVDSKRIAIMGAGRGGRVALMTALEPLRHALAGGDLRFAAHIALYAGCDIRFVSRQVDGSPALFLHGEADDYAPIQHCREYAESLARAGAVVEFVAIPGAAHEFDRDLPFGFRQEVSTAVTCDLERDLDTGFAKRMDTGKLVIGRTMRAEYYQSCTGRGAHLGRNPDADSIAVRAIQSYLRQVFRLPKPK